MKKTVTVVTILAFGLTSILFQNCSSSGHDKELQQVANGVNKLCPFMADKDTRLDNIAVLPGDVLQYNYTLVNLAKADVDTNQLINYLKPKVVENVKSNPDMKTLKSYNVTMAYVYKDTGGVYLFTVACTPADYK